MNKSETVKNILNELLSHYGVKYTLTINELEDSLTEAVIEGENLSFLIGFRGECLNGLQTFMNLVIFKKLGEWHRVVVDINGYRKQKNEKIVEITKNYIDRVRFMQKDVEMPIMNATERKQVHTYVADYPDIQTESVGIEPGRRIVLKLKQN